MALTFYLVKGDYELSAGPSGRVGPENWRPSRKRDTSRLCVHLAQPLETLDVVSGFRGLGFRGFRV